VDDQLDCWAEATEVDAEVLCPDADAALVCREVVNVLKGSKYATAGLLLGLHGAIITIAQQERDGWRIEYGWAGREGFVIIRKNISRPDKCSPVVRKVEPLYVVQPLVLGCGLCREDIIRAIDEGVDAIMDHALSG
jgi:hypothetical protein